MLLLEQEFDVSATSGESGWLDYLAETTARRLPGHLVPIRFVVTSSTGSSLHCEVGAISGLADSGRSVPPSIFRFARRRVENRTRFNA